MLISFAEQRTLMNLMDTLGQAPLPKLLDTFFRRGSQLNTLATVSLSRAAHQCNCHLTAQSVLSPTVRSSSHFPSFSFPHSHYVFKVSFINQQLPPATARLPSLSGPAREISREASAAIFPTCFAKTAGQCLSFIVRTHHDQHLSVHNNYRHSYQYRPHPTQRVRTTYMRSPIIIYTRQGQN